ncbi:E3 ubiquitin-protein ligase MIB2-like isoform X1 [Saccostrea echinata]|uniref:E3 ubiquitin-protein ligase MIB2-like isoform X1 n=1 Tax=Saccostrea echinata TaxID=191078 RepID=UPI002A7F38A8|nr:E3 ubiquitin-protein ligase MIB2-like isoform X1 [Saccostrea echinata]
MAEGLRVVRGPDWNLGNEDKGEGHVGTVVKDNGDQSYDVVWDMGGKSTCRVGIGGKFDLRILDNAPIGVKHLSRKCAGCQKNTIIGVLWKCASCDDINLCTPCYYMDKHDLNHPFQRIDKRDATSIDIPKRANSVKMKALGIFPGAKVIRGPNWEFGTQDGGTGKKGKVEDIRGYGSDAGGRNAVRVRWETSGEANVYRVGCRGKVDLQCVEEAPGGYYYREHLPVAGKIASTQQKNDKNSSGQSSESVLKKGDKCVIDMPEQPLKELQRGHGGWSVRMSECIGEVAVVKDFPSDTTVEVEYKDRTYQFHAGAVRKVYDIKVGDIVQVLKDETKAILLQRNHGGWNDDMKKSLGLVGKVVKIDSDGDVAVAFGNQAWVYNPGLLVPVSGRKVDVLEDEGNDMDEPSQSRDSPESDQRYELGGSLAQLMAHLVLLEALGARQTIGPQEMFNACAKGNISAVHQMIQRRKDLVNSWFKSLTPLMVAGHEGHVDIMKLLLQNGANINASNDDGMTPLLVSIIGKEEDTSICLIRNKADVNVCNKHGRCAAHLAVEKELYSVLKAVLEAGASPNKQDVEGDTPLHDAIGKRSDRAVAILLSHPQINLKILNKKGHIPLMWAAFKDHDFAVERLVAKDPSLVNARKNDGYTALHIAAINDHSDSANVLILKGKAQVNAKNSQGLTPLHLAAHEGYDGMAKVLIMNGADVNIKDGDGDTPLHLALGGQRQTAGGNDPFLRLLGLTVNPNAQNQERYNMAVLMIQKGADYEAMNNRGNAPLEVCKNAELRRAVNNFIQKTRASRPSTGRGGAAGRAPTPAEVLQGLFAELPIPCVRCKDSTANTRLLPCKHKVLCTDCCFRVQQCPMCRQPVSNRCDLQGRILVDPCRLQ